ncbi:MAG TPA: hypothetical protein VGG19_04545 [Tepidisphaeraceae bacterium]|jgi:hypothetical protein
MRWFCHFCAIGVLAASSVALATPSYTAVFLPTSGYTSTYAVGIANGQIVGYSTEYPGAGLLWNSPTAAPIVMTPVGYDGSGLGSTNGTIQGGDSGIAGEGHAMIWSGQSNDYIDLNPPGFIYSGISGIGGDQEVGNGASPTTSTLGDALLWIGTSNNAIDLNPSGFNYSTARATNGTYQVGSGNFTSQGPSGPVSNTHALLWSGSASSVVDLNPPGYSYSEAWGISGDVVAGWGISGHSQDALLWNISDGTYTDLGPGEAYAIAGNYEVGYRTVGPNHAMLWAGSAASAVDLNNFLPEGYASIAYGVDANGDVVGVASNSSGYYAVEWIAPEPAFFAPIITVLAYSHLRRK